MKTTKHTDLERRSSGQHSRLHREGMTGELLGRPAVKPCGRQKGKEEVVFLLANVFDQLCVHMRAQSLQLCTALWGPVDCSLPGSSCPWHSLDKNTGEGCHFLLQGILPSQHQTLVSYVSCVTGVLYRVTFEILQAALTSRTNLHVSISKSTSIKSERNLQRLKKKKKDGFQWYHVGSSGKNKFR